MHWKAASVAKNCLRQKRSAAKSCFSSAMRFSMSARRLTIVVTPEFLLGVTAGGEEDTTDVDSHLDQPASFRTATLAFAFAHHHETPLQLPSRQLESELADGEVVVQRCASGLRVGLRAG